MGNENLMHVNEGRFFFKDLFMGGVGKGKGREVDSLLSAEPDFFLNPTTQDHDLS